MGVPKFFRFISERYPCLSEVVKEYELPEFDNFYIDANGIIHNCSHPDDSVHFRITEEDIFKDIFHYLEMLFRLIKPKKLFFIAIDGVAPRAKMNQQRSRRFRTAKDVEKGILEAVKKGEILPDTERFDSNCITPGTVFMEKLHRQLQYFIKKKISTEELWQKPKIILSGHNVPGEGEHKIMDYIRFLRSQSDWNPNTRHCLHGLDADLIMLGLCTHEPHFALLREEVKFGKHANKRKTNVEETKFFLLHLSLMREYLDLEFQSLKKSLPFPYDIERIIDDWVLMGFLVGNDFIPNLPQFHIANNALFILYKAYMVILPTLDGYINDCGTLNLKRFEKYLEKLAEVDFENFRDESTDLKYFESKTGKKFPGTGGASVVLDELDVEVPALPEGIVSDALLLEGFDDEIKALANDTFMMVGNDDDDSSDNDLRQEFKMFKADFYKNKLEYDKVDSSVLRDQAECYVRAIQWNLSYYYTGCPSWSWFYPHHYSPYVSDVRDFSSMDITFGQSKPFLPFQQLLAVLPALSKTLVPEPFQDLMTSPDSPIIQFYPSEFETDLNGKQHEWEAVVLIPFIEENSLLSAMNPLYKDLTEEEHLRNSRKPMEVYQYTKENLGRCEAPEFFAAISDNHAALTEVWRKDIMLSPDKLVKGLLPGAVFGAYLGFPHLRGISFTAQLCSSKVKVFDHPSRGDNMILKIHYNAFEDDEAIDKVAHDLMGRIVFVGWPHIQRGKVTSIHTEKHQYRFDSGKVRKSSDKDTSFLINSEELRRSYSNTLGIHLNTVDVVVYCKTVEDVRYRFEGKVAKLDYLWSRNAKPFPYQTTLKEAPLLDKGEAIGLSIELSEIFYQNREVFILDSDSHYGELGLVKSINDDGNIEVEIEHKPDLDFSGILDLSRETDLKYYPGNIAAQRLGLSSYLFSRVTGSIFIQNIENEEKLNIGLGLKYTKQGEELIGFTRKDKNFWTYSEKSISLLDDYMAKFPELFEYLEKHSGNDIFFNKDIFPENSKEKISEIKMWLKAQPHTGAERRPIGATLLTSAAMKEIEKRVLTSDLNKILKRETVSISPSKLFIPPESMGKAPPDHSISTFVLDRVVSVRKNHNIPLGLKGSVIGFDKYDCIDTLYDIIFDEPIPGGRNLACDEARVYRLPHQAFINCSQGRKSSHRVYRPANRKMEFYANNRDDSKMSFPSPNKEFQNFSFGNNKVKQFFDGYINSGKVSSPQENRPFIPNTERQSRADSEFQAMWNVLQTRQVSEDVPMRPETKPEEVLSPVDSSVIEQTNALRKLLKLQDSSVTSPESQKPKPLLELRPQVPPNFNQQANMKSNPPANVNMAPMQMNHLNFGRHPVKSCGHINCCSELVQICKSRSISYPQFKYNRIKSSGEVLCTVTFFNEYGNVVGDACRTDEEAAENAGCKATRLILQQDDKRRPIVPNTLGYRLPYPAMRHPFPNSPTGSPRLPVGTVINAHQSLGQLPSPPTKWCQSSGWPMGMQSEKQFTQNNKRLPKGASSPNQGPPQRQIPSSSSSGDMRAEPGEERLKSGGRGQAPKQPDAGNRVPPSNAKQTDQKRKPGGRPRARLAANFSVPINQNPS